MLSKHVLTHRPDARRYPGQGRAWSGSCPQEAPGLIIQLAPHVLALQEGGGGNVNQEPHLLSMADVSPENLPNCAQRKFMVVEITQGQSIIGSGFCGERLRSTEL